MSGKRLGKRLRTGPLPEKRFDMEREPVEQKMYLMPIVWGFSYINTIARYWNATRMNCYATAFNSSRTCWCYF